MIIFISSRRARAGYARDSVSFAPAGRLVGVVPLWSICDVRPAARRDGILLNQESGAQVFHEAPPCGWGHDWQRIDTQLAAGMHS